MPSPALCFEEVRTLLKQRFPVIMIDTVAELNPGKSIRAIKNVTGNEIQFLGHFPDRAIMPGSMIVEAIGQAASILFSKATGKGIGAEEYLVLGLIKEMRFLRPIVPGDQMEISAQVLKIADDLAFVEGNVNVGGVLAARGSLGFARRAW